MTHCIVRRAVETVIRRRGGGWRSVASGSAGAELAVAFWPSAMGAWMELRAG